MISLKQAVIVEGKYDKIKLSGLVDALILQTDGFRIFKDPEKRALIKKLAQTTGIVIITDSDKAGNLIRNHIKSIAKDGEIYQAYIPQILGKEKRKAKPSKEGTLGVEGMQDEVVLEALKKCGVTQGKREFAGITKFDMMQAGLSGTEGSQKRREELLNKLSLPKFLTAKALLDILNYTYTKEEFYKMTEDLEKGE